MELNYKQKGLLIITSVSLLGLMLVLGSLERNLWLSALSFAPFIPYCLLTLTTNQKIFNVKKQWGHLLIILGVLQLLVIQGSVTFILGYFGYPAKVYVYLVFAVLCVLYFYLYMKNLQTANKNEVSKQLNIPN